MKIGLILFLILLGIASLQTKAQSAQPQTLEQKLQAYYQQLYSQNLFAVYKACHPLGNKFGFPLAVTVTAAKITQWKNAVPSEEPNDIQQFTVDYTVLWKSARHPNGGGHTEARSTYVVTNDDMRPVANTILSTNAVKVSPAELIGLHPSITKLALILLK